MPTMYGIAGMENSDVSPDGPPGTEGPLICGGCGRSFRNVSSYERHVDDAGICVKCPFCRDGWSYPSKEEE